jgi:hypothetical protein
MMKVRGGFIKKQKPETPYKSIPISITREMETKTENKNQKKIVDKPLKLQLRR